MKRTTLYLLLLVSIQLQSCRYDKNEKSSPTLILILYDLSGSVSTNTVRNDHETYTSYLQGHIKHDKDQIHLAFIGDEGVNTARAKTWAINQPYVKNELHNELEEREAKQQYQLALDQSISSTIEHVQREIDSKPRNAPETGILEIFPLIERISKTHADYDIKILFVSDMVQASGDFSLITWENQTSHIKLRTMDDVDHWKDSTIHFLERQYSIRPQPFLSGITEISIHSPCFSGTGVNCPDNMGYIESYWEQVFSHYGVPTLTYSIGR